MPMYKIAENKQSMYKKDTLFFKNKMNINNNNQTSQHILCQSKPKTRIHPGMQICCNYMKIKVLPVISWG